MTAHRWLFLVLLPVLAQDPARSEGTVATTVRTHQGYVRGMMEEGIHRFLGIPFTEPPVGPLRWKPPVPRSSWGDTLAAVSFCNRCMQKDYRQGDPDSTATISGNEDCLYLNVWTPSLQDSILPVMVWIHGGGNQQGSASDSSGGAPMFDGFFLAARESVVVVTINYRLGPLGYLVHRGLETESPTSTSGNYGLLDQVQALAWVRENIGFFGGSKHNVTIFGESAGAMNVATLLAVPSAAGLFHRAIAQSGTPRARAYGEMMQSGKDLVDSLGLGGLSDQEQILQLRAASPESLVRFLTNPTAGGIIDPPWGPTVDGVVLPEDPTEAVTGGRHHHVPVLIGSNARETSMMVPPTVTPLMFQTLVALAVPVQFRPRALQLYPPGTTSGQALESYINFTTDGSFTAPSRRFARALAIGQSEPVWRYSFEHHFPGPVSAYGAFHGAEIFYVFNSFERTPYGLLILEDDRTMLRLMRSQWAQFARTGDPALPDLPLWIPYHPSTDPYQILSPAPGTGSGLRSAHCDFLDSLRLLTDVQTAEDTRPAVSALLQNYPNPFNPSTTVRFRLGERADVSLHVYDILGRPVAELAGGVMDAGTYEVPFDAARLATGMYVTRLRAGNTVLTQKMLVVR